MVLGEVAAAHAAAIVEDGERALNRVGSKGQHCCARVDGIGDDLGQDRLLRSARIGVAEIIEKMQEIDARFAHRLINPA